MIFIDGQGVVPNGRDLLVLGAVRRRLADRSVCLPDLPVLTAGTERGEIVVASPPEVDLATASVLASRIDSG